MKREDNYYCYLDDAIGEKFIADLYEPNEGKYGMVGNKEYEDPDAVSEKLYNDLMNCYNNSSNFLRLSRHESLLNLVDQYGRRYSTDFIGPSRAWSNYIGINKKEIGNYLKKTRTIGGHIFWPLNGTSRTMNTARGGGNSLYDRIDMTLMEIRNYYQNKEAWYSNGLRNVIEKEKEWFSLFEVKGNGIESFKKFIDYMMLNPLVIDDDYKVISLVKSDIKNNKYCVLDINEPIFPGNIKGIGYKKIIEINEVDEEYGKVLRKSFNQYINNSISIIQERNRIMED